MPGAQNRIRAQLLHSIAEVACTLVSGRAASVGLLDDDELVFVATAGIAAEEVEGARIRATEGVAGQVLQSGEAVLAKDLSKEPRFAREIAIATGYEPDAMAVAPIRRAGEIIGVIEVLDPMPDSSLLVPLTLLAAHAAVALDVSAELTGGES
jgi:signal transduction protein with GAF and PtsI domain